MNQFWVADIGAHLYLRDETDIFGLIQTGHYEPEETQIIKKFVKKDDICVDIGANIGYFTVLMAKLGRFVYAFEPEESNFRMLVKNLALNQLTNVNPKMHAVGDDSNIGDLYICQSNHGMHRTYPSKWCEKTPKSVSFVRLDNELRGLEVDFVKMDIEGWEFHALKGMATILLKSQPTLLIEFHPPTLQEAGTNPESMYLWILNQGYDIYLATEPAKPISYEDLYAKTNDSMGGQNILCIASMN